MRKNGLIAVLFLLGIAMLIYPLIDRSIQDYKQNKLLAEWDHYKDLELIDSSKAKSALQDREPLSPNLDEESPQPGQQEEPKKMLHGLTLLGAIHIPAIDVDQPILEGSTEKSLKYGIGTVVPEVKAGEIGNFVLAGHRGRSYGKLLNRLNELKEGDEIVVESLSENYRYYVTEAFLVEPDELWVLEEDDSSRELTLITCHPVKNPTHRLIVRAEMLQEMEKTNL